MMFHAFPIFSRNLLRFGKKFVKFMTKIVDFMFFFINLMHFRFFGQICHVSGKVRESHDFSMQDLKEIGAPDKKTSQL